MKYQRCALEGCNNKVGNDSPVKIVKGKTVRFCSSKHAEIYSNPTAFESYRETQREMRRNLLKGAAVAGIGGTLVGLLGGIGIGRSQAAIDTTKPATISSFSQLGEASFIVLHDKSGNNYVVDKGGGTQPGSLVVNANVITSYGASIGVGTQGASSTTSGIQEATNNG